MTVPCFSYSAFIEYLNKFGYVVVDPQPQDFWSACDRIIVKNGDHTFPLQYRDRYFYRQAVPLLLTLGLPIPDDHQHSWDMFQEEKSKHIEAAKAAKESAEAEAKDTDKSSSAEE